MAALLCAGNMQAQTVLEMTQRVKDLTKNPASSVIETDALIQQVKAMTSTPFNNGSTLSPEQQNYNELVNQTVTMLNTKVSKVASNDYAKSREAWNIARSDAYFAGRGDEAIDYANRLRLANATPGPFSEWIFVRAHFGQDVRADVKAAIAAPRGWSMSSIPRLAQAWILSAQNSNDLKAEELNAVLADMLAVFSKSAPLTRETAVRFLAMRAATGQNVNADILTLMGSIRRTLPWTDAEKLTAAFNIGATNPAEIVAFYDAILCAVEVTEESAPFIRKILDQKLKF